MKINVKSKAMKNKTYFTIEEQPKGCALVVAHFSDKEMPLYNFGGCKPSAKEFIEQDLPQMGHDEIMRIAKEYNPDARFVRVFEKGKAVIVEYPTKLTSRKVR